MRIRWENIFGLMLLAFFIYLFIKMKPFWEHIFESINGVYYYRHDLLLKVLMLTLLCLTAVAIAKIISRR
ncbi:MAG: hypothetical protein ACYS17_13760 [Planctomycetota bacterium]|jgi:hypothetical protein